MDTSGCRSPKGSDLGSVSESRVPRSIRNNKIVYASGAYSLAPRWGVAADDTAPPHPLGLVCIHQ